MALGLTQHLTDMSTRNISVGGKGSRYVGLTTLSPSCADCLEIWEPQSLGTVQASAGVALPIPYRQYTLYYYHCDCVPATYINP